MSGHRRPRRREDFQVAIICALPLEYDSAALVFDEFWDGDNDQLGKVSGDYNVYRTGRVGRHNVVLLLLPNMGKVGAASAAANLRSTYTGIKLAVLAGICGGVPNPGSENELLLGDVVISKSVVQYDLGRQYSDQFVRRDTVDDALGRPSKEIRTLIASFETRSDRDRLQRRVDQILQQIQQKTAGGDGDHDLYQRPSASEDLLFEPGYIHRHRDDRACGCSEAGACKVARDTSCEKLRCDKGHLVSRKRLKNRQDRPGDASTAHGTRVFVGRVGSGDTVMKSGLDRDRIAAEHGLVAFEMEGAGVWDEIPCIIVKAVCDYADSHKNKNWQDFAAARAASTTKALLEQYAQTDSPTDIPAWFHVPYNENPDFVGRSKVLDQVKKLFGHGQHPSPTPKPRSRVAIYGLGGIGKTQIALAYAYWIKEVCPDMSVFWVHASSMERFRQAYSSIALVCDIPGRDDPKKDVLSLVKTWLEEKGRGRWLMVIDNADDTQAFFPSQSTGQAAQSQHGIGRYIPECSHGSILITTRNKQTGSRLVRGKSLIEVGEMSNSEARELLHTILDDDVISSEEASGLSDRLENLPLALSQAASFVQENSISIGEYIKLMDENDDSLVERLSEPFEAAGRDSETPHALTTTWIISFNQIQRQHALAGEVLSLVSLFDRQAIPKKFVADYYQERREAESETGVAELGTSVAAEVTKTLGVLKAFCFLSEAKDDTVDMHRLVQLVTRKWLANQDRLAGFAEHALKTVANAYPYGRYENRVLCQDYLPHAYAVLKNKRTDSRDGDIAKASLLHRMAGYFLYRGQWIESEDGGIQATNLRTELLGEDHPDTLSSVSNLATTYWNQGRWKEAEELDVQVIETRKRVLGEEHSDTLTSIANLAATYWTQGRWKEAEKLDLEVMEIRLKALGEEDPETLSSMANLAATYWKLGRRKEAEELELRVIEIRKRVIGEEHPSTLNSMSNLAAIYWRLGRWKESEALDMRVMETRKRVLGEEHPDVLSSMTGLSASYRSQGRWKEAEELAIRVVETTRRVFTEEHPDTINSIANLAATYWKQGRLDEAEEMNARVMESRKRVLGEEHPDTLTAMVNLAYIWKELGRLEDAMQLLRDGVRLRQQRLGLDHPETVSSLSTLTSWETEQKRESREELKEEPMKELEEWEDEWEKI
ncbi:hypothetical protein EsH8_V_000381 [Colletotrichum jinshuiense]